MTLSFALAFQISYCKDCGLIMLKVYSNHSLLQYVDYMKEGHQRGGPGAVAPFAPFKIHHCSTVMVEIGADLKSLNNV